MKWILPVCLMISVVSQSQEVYDSLAVKYAETITAEELQNHLMILASDEYEGRETGMKGQKIAAEYIENYFKELGVPPCFNGGYQQPYPLKRSSNSKSEWIINRNELEYIKDFYFFPGFDLNELKSEEIVVVGYGIQSSNWNDYEGLDVEDKVVLAIPDEPFLNDSTTVLGGVNQSSEWSSDFRVKRKAAMDQGAKALIMVNEDYDNYVGRIRYFLENPNMRLDMEREEREEVLPVIFIKPDLADKLIKKTKLKSIAKAKRKMNKKQHSITGTASCSMTFKMNKVTENFTGENVLCFIEGSDAELKEEIVVVTAHYDHIGMKDGEVNNGADDDGSGTVTALEISEAFMYAKKDGNGPRRSVLVMTVSGEEKGLLGSEWYAAHPVFPLENTVVDLNVDMIGRVDEAHKGDSNYIYLIGSDKLSSSLHQISEWCNETYSKIALDYTYNDPNDPNRFYYRSDHYNFAKHDIPVIFYFSGVHEDYHRPTDTPDKILYDKTANVAKLIFHTAWQLANRDDRIQVDIKNDFE